MKKILLALLIVSTTFVFSQNINEERNGFVEIVKVDSLNKTEIYNKLKEWITLNYKSANDVIQLDTEDKIIAKGNMTFTYLAGKYNLNYRISNTLIFSIRDNKFKIDFVPTGINSIEYPDVQTSNSTYEMFISDEVLTKEDYEIFALKSAQQTYANMGYSEDKIKKLLNSLDKYLEDGFRDYKINKESFDKTIKDIFISVKNNVNNKDDW